MIAFTYPRTDPALFRQMEPSSSPFSITVQGTTLSGLSRRVVEANLLSREQARETSEAAQKSQRSFLREALDPGTADQTGLLRCAPE